jgi:hypothetical protein
MRDGRPARMGTDAPSPVAPASGGARAHPTATRRTRRPRLGPRRAGPDGTRPRRRRVDLLPYVLVTPLVLFIIGLAIIPAGYTLGQSFFRVQELDPPTRFNGLDNFRALLADPAVRGSVGNTALYILIGVTLSRCSASSWRSRSSTSSAAARSSSPR